MPDSPSRPSDIESCPGRDVCPVCRALGLRDGLRIWFGGNDTRAKRDIAPHVHGLTFPPTGPLDLAVIAARDRAEADYFRAKVSPRLAERALVWVSVLDDHDGTERPRAVRVGRSVLVESSVAD